jgi:hypothetical protein
MKWKRKKKKGIEKEGERRGGEKGEEDDTRKIKYCSNPWTLI